MFATKALDDDFLCVITGMTQAQQEGGRVGKGDRGEVGVSVPPLSPHEVAKFMASSTVPASLQINMGMNNAQPFGHIYCLGRAAVVPNRK